MVDSAFVAAVVAQLAGTGGLPRIAWWTGLFVTSWVAVLLAFAIASPPGAPTAARSEQQTADVTAILMEVVLDRVAASGEAPGGDYVVVLKESHRLCPEGAPTTDPGCSSSDPGPRLSRGTALPAVSPGLQKALVEANRDEHDLPWPSMPAARVAPRQQVYRIFSGKGWWEEFYKQFPGSRGFIEVSAPAFGTDRNQALTYVSHSCGGLCGTGWLLYFERQPGGWTIQKRVMLWIS